MSDFIYLSNKDLGLKEQKCWGCSQKSEFSSKKSGFNQRKLELHQSNHGLRWLSSNIGTPYNWASITTNGLVMADANGLAGITKYHDFWQHVWQSLLSLCKEREWVITSVSTINSIKFPSNSHQIPIKFHQIPSQLSNSHPNSHQQPEFAN